MNVVLKKAMHGMAVVLAGLAVAGCVSKPAVSRKDVVRVQGVAKLFVAPPVVECMDCETGSPTTLKGYDVDGLETRLLTRLSLFAAENVFFRGGNFISHNVCRGAFSKTACSADLAR